MKKVLFVLAVLAIASCDRWKQQPENSIDSTKVTETVEAPAKKILIAQMVGDSIAAAHGPNYYNKLVQEDIGNDLKKYINKFRGKHCPMIEELPFKFNDVIKDGSAYIAAFQFKEKVSDYRMVEMQLAIRVTREEATKLVKNQNYHITGVVKGIKYVNPYFIPSDTFNSQDVISYGAIEISDAKIE